MRLPERHLSSQHREGLWERLLAHREVNGECWEWTGWRINGYGRITIGNRQGWLVHRAAYELLVGPIPDGLTIDHLCRNRACFNPAHLEPVEFTVNVLRGIGPAAQNARRTACRKGHIYTDGSFIREQQGNGVTGRRCVICRRERERVAYHSGRGSHTKASR